MKLKSIIIAGIILAGFEVLIQIPEHAPWIILGILLVTAIGGIEKNNTSYSLITTALIAQISLLVTLFFTESQTIEQILSIMAALLAYEFIEPAKKERHVERQGRNETISQRFVQVGLLVIMVLWFNATTKMAEEFSMIFTPILLNIGATAIIIFHIQKTYTGIFERTTAVLFSVATAAIIAQLTWMALLLPFSVLTKTMIIGSALYVMLNIIEQEQKKILTTKNMLPALTIGALSVIITIATGPWQT